jgi:hypothetical protein
MNAVNQTKTENKVSPKETNQANKTQQKNVIPEADRLKPEEIMEIPALPLSYFEGLKKENPTFFPNLDDTKKAYSNILTNWNKSRKTRNFVKHLFASFLPIDRKNVLWTLGESKVFCAITGLELIGFKTIIEETQKISAKKLEIVLTNFVSDNDNDEKVVDDVKGANFAEFNELIKNLDEKIKFFRFGMSSDKSDKTISNAAIVALNTFYLQLMPIDSKEIDSMVHARVFNGKENLKSEDKQKPKNFGIVDKLSDYNDHLDDKSLNALKSLKFD